MISTEWSDLKLTDALTLVAAGIKTLYMYKVGVLLSGVRRAFQLGNWKTLDDLSVIFYSYNNYRWLFIVMVLF